MFCEVGPYRINCYMPEDRTATKVVYLHLADGREKEAVWQLILGQSAFITIEGFDWNRDMSPWYHDKVFAKGEDFAGKADEYLDRLCERVIPEAESRFGLHPEKRYLAGYSLSGLLALYALYRTELFDAAASVSGSLWYEGFVDFIKENEPLRRPERIYLSLGDKETSSAGGIMKQVLIRTREAEAVYTGRGIETIFEMNPGNHFTHVPERIAKGINRLLQD